MSKDYYYTFTIIVDNTPINVGIVDNRTGEWEACTGNNVLNDYINNDADRFDFYDGLVQIESAKQSNHEKKVIKDFQQSYVPPIISEQNA